MSQEKHYYESVKQSLKNLSVLELSCLYIDIENELTQRSNMLAPIQVYSALLTNLQAQSTKPVSAPTWFKWNEKKQKAFASAVAIETLRLCRYSGINNSSSLWLFIADTLAPYIIEQSQKEGAPLSVTATMLLEAVPHTIPLINKGFPGYLWDSGIAPFLVQHINTYEQTNVR